MLVVDFSVMRVLLYKRAWLKKETSFCARKNLPKMVKIYANPSFHSRCSHLVNSKRTRKLSPLSKWPHLRRTKIESGGGTSHVLPTARYCLMNDSRNQKNKEKKRKEKTQRHSMVSVLIGFTDGMYKSNLLNSNMGLGPTTLRFPFAHALYKELTHFCYWNVWGGKLAQQKGMVIGYPLVLFSESLSTLSLFLFLSLYSPPLLLARVAHVFV